MSPSTSASRSQPQEPVRLKPTFYNILLALGDGEMHGYAIMQSLLEKSGGREQILPGSLYGSIARMVKDGLIEDIDPPEADASGGPQRRYYRRSELGHAMARAESERLQALLKMAVDQDLIPGMG